jgi:DNA-binding SARP family transcriptional activator
MLRLFGEPELASAGDIGFPAKGFQLLALIARSPDRRVARRHVISLFWPDADAADGFANLRQLIARMRRAHATTGELIRVDDRKIALGPDADVIDLCAFEEWAGLDDPGRVLDGLGLFRGDLLGSLAEPCEEFADWLRQERGVLREQFFAAAGRALREVTRYGRASEHQIAFIGDRMLALDREREETYRALMDAYRRNGMLYKAGATYRSLQLMLGREPGMRPAAETAALARRVFAAARDISAAPSHTEIVVESVRPRVAFFAPLQVTAGERIDLLRALVEDIANELARYRTFAVMAPHSSFQTRHDSGMPLERGPLRADYTVSGFVKPTAPAPVLALRMVKCADGTISWAGEFPVGIKDLAGSFRLIAHRVAAHLAAELERDFLGELVRSQDVSAYRHYLEGQSHFKRCTLACLRRARTDFRLAADADPTFAAAYGRIGQTLYLEWLILGGTDPQLLRQAHDYAERTIALDRGSALGYWISGAVALYQRDFELSMERFAEARTLNPNGADLILEYGDALSHNGDAEAGWHQFELALDCNPRPPDHYWWAGASIAFHRQDFATAIRLSRNLTSEEPVLRVLAASHAHLGDLGTARMYGRQLNELYPGQSAAEMVKLVPDRNHEDRQLFFEGLRLAGIS